MTRDVTSVAHDRRTVETWKDGDDLSVLERDHPAVFALLDPLRVRDHADRAADGDLDLLSWEFEGSGVGGRGEAYNLAQRASGNRRIGMGALIGLFSPSFSDLPPADYDILDVLAGDGVVANFVAGLGEAHPSVISSDASRLMVDACRRQGLACLRQSAADLLFRDRSLDGVLIAYGSHHLDPRSRRDAVAEAHRTLKAGRRVVLHDFEAGGSTARWFEEVVHPFSRTGHDHPHFTRLEMFGLLDAAGFRDVRVLDMADPFTLSGETEEAAKSNALMHLHRMYDLVKITNDESDLLSRLERHVARTLGPVSVEPDGDGYVASIPRRALVAVGTKAE